MIKRLVKEKFKVRRDFKAIRKNKVKGSKIRLRAPERA